MQSKVVCFGSWVPAFQMICRVQGGERMSGGITVTEFKHIPGVNGAEYIKKLEELHENDKRIISTAVAKIKKLSAQLKEQPEIIRCHECKHNPKKEWFGCPMAHLNERQRPEDAWCWRGEREEK